jgi:hypothetical protein
VDHCTLTDFFFLAGIICGNIFAERTLTPTMAIAEYNTKYNTWPVGQTLRIWSLVTVHLRYVAHLCHMCGCEIRPTIKIKLKIKTKIYKFLVLKSS